MSIGAVSDPEAIMAAVDRFEAVARRQCAVDHRLTHRLTSQASPVKVGGTSWTDVLSHRPRGGPPPPRWGRRSRAAHRMDPPDPKLPTTRRRPWRDW